MDEVPTSEPIRLEMSRNAKIGCVAVPVVLILLAVVFCSIAKSRGSETAKAAAERIYTMAEIEDYKGLKSLVSLSALLTLQKAVATNGKISAWKVTKTDTGIVGRPSTVYVDVTRNGKQYVDLGVSRNSMQLEVIVEYPKGDFEKGIEDHIVRVIAK